VLNKEKLKKERLLFFIKKEKEREKGAKKEINLHFSL
jgi:hypothetical protein